MEHVLLAVSLIFNVVSGIVIYRASRSLLSFDEVFEYLVSDIDVNIRYLEKLSNTPTFSNSEEVMLANKNMKVIAQRLDEIVLRMEESSGRRLRKIKQNVEKRVPPVVIG